MMESAEVHAFRSSPRSIDKFVGSATLGDYDGKRSECIVDSRRKAVYNSRVLTCSVEPRTC